MRSAYCVGVRESGSATAERNVKFFAILLDKAILTWYNGWNRAWRASRRSWLCRANLTSVLSKSSTIRKSIETNGLFGLADFFRGAVGVNALVVEFGALGVGRWNRKGVYFFGKFWWKCLTNGVGAWYNVGDFGYLRFVFHCVMPQNGRRHRRVSSAKWRTQEPRCGRKHIRGASACAIPQFFAKTI